MATTTGENATSSRIRSQIPLALARLKRCLHTATTLLNTKIPSDPPDDLDELYCEFLSVRASLLRPLTQLQKLHNTWKALMETMPKEREIYDDYIHRCGDYLQTMHTTIPTLESMDKKIADLEEKAKELQIPLTTEDDKSIMEDKNSESSNVFEKKSPNPPEAPVTTPPPGLPVLQAQEQPPVSQIQRLHLVEQAPGQPQVQPAPGQLQVQTAPGQPQAHQATVRPHHMMTHHDHIQAAQEQVSAVHAQLPPTNFYQAPDVLSTGSPLDAALLQRLDIPSFSGSLIEYPEFWTRFSSLVHSKTSIDDGSKFSLLKTCLRGSALQCIAGIPVTAENYEIAISLLHSTYHDTATLRHILFSKLLALPSCDEKSLAHRFAQMNALVRQFIVYDPGSHECGLAAALFNKLPRSVRGRVLDKMPSRTNMTPTLLMDILGDIVRREFVIDSMMIHEQQHDAFMANSRHVNSSRKTSGKENFAQQKNGKAWKRPCAFCEADHPPAACNKFTSSNQRINIVKEKRLCYNCLSKTHTFGKCNSKKTCRNCNRAHHTAICREKEKAEQPATGQREGYRQTTPARTSYTPRGPPRTDSGRNPAQHAHVAVEETIAPQMDEHIHMVTSSQSPSATQEQSPSLRTSSVALMCLPLTLRNPDKPEISITTTAFLDSGSTRSYITTAVAEQLELSCLKEEELVVNSFGHTRSVLPARLHLLHLQLPDKSTIPLDVRSIANIAQEIPCVMIPQDSSNSQDDTCPAIERRTPGILIGADYFWSLLISDQFSVRSLSDGLQLITTRIGAMIAGSTFQLDHVYNVANEADSSPLSLSSLHQLLEKFWEIENIGISPETSNSDEDSICLKHFQDNIRFDEQEKRYYVKWPFRFPTTDLPTNRRIAYSRLWSTWRSLNSQPELLEQYNEIIQEQLRKGIIEIVPTDEEKPGQEHYLPHHCVQKDHRTTKCRIVFDASCKERGKLSLNESLYKGPLLLPDLCGILLRSRLAPILLSADIEKAFLMIGLEEPDRDYTRFFWLADPNLPPSADNLMTLRFASVPFGIITSPFMLNGTIHTILSNDGSSIASKVLTNLYVDNSFLSIENVAEGKHIYRYLKKLFADGNMNLREWISNNPELNEYFKEKEGMIPDGKIKILGIPWDNVKDQLKIILQQPEVTSSWTKRKVMQFVASNYDPLGLLAPILLRYKVFLQSLWVDQQSWDHVLTDEQHSTWKELLEGNSTDQSYLEIPRFFGQIPDNSDVSLHLFCDASAAAYAAVAYLRVSKDSKTVVFLLMAKSKLSPLKQKLTTPRLELSAIVMASSLANYLQKELHLKLQSTWIWSDSKIALSWCATEKHQPIFITNRVNKIKANVPNIQFRHVRSEDNPADVASRGCTFTELSNDELWWKGPKFLHSPESTWPKQPEITPTADEAAALLQPPAQQPEIAFSATESITPFLELERYSSWSRLVNTLLLILFYVRLKLGNKIFSKINFNVSNIENTVTLHLFRMAQLQYPPSEQVIKRLHLQKDVSRGLSLWILRSRVDPEKSLIYLPPESRITTLFILATHQDLLHSGTNCTLNHTRKNVWIHKGKAAVKKAIRAECLQCRRYQSKPFALPPFPPLPSSRKERPPYPFYNCGMDYLGPYKVQGGQQVHICLFTCLATRLIYTAVAVDLRAHTFLNLLRRFIATYGTPKTIISDNAPQFTTTASAYISLIMDDSSLLELRPLTDRKMFPDIHNLCNHQRITFKFIPAFSPWSGGVYERMVGLFKNALRFALGRNVPNIDDFSTFVTEAAAVVNCRPLTSVSSDPKDPVTALRPLDFARPFSNNTVPHGEKDNDSSPDWNFAENAQQLLLGHWKETISILDKFWDRYFQEYVQELKDRHAVMHNQSTRLTRREPEEGEVVLVHSDATKRNNWRLARIIEILHDPIRSVKVKLANGNEITRPISLLYPLEIRSNTTEPSTQQRNTAMPSHPMVTRSKGKKMSPLLFATIMMTLLSIAQGHKCPANLQDKKILFAESCKASAVSILRYSGSSGPALCWDMLNCPFGHVRFKPDLPPNTGFCGEECNCPPTFKCVYYDGIRRKESMVDKLPDQFLHYKPDYVCSFEPNNACDSTAKMTTVPVINLHSGTSIIVKELHVQQPQFDKEDLPICVSLEGKLVEHTSELEVWGTSGFCTSYSCSPKPAVQIFCLLREPSAIFTEGNFTIPIASWGYALRSYYPFNLNVTQSIGPTASLICTKGGILIFNAGNSFIEACIQTACVHIKSYEDGELILFPTSLLLSTYVVTVKSWKEGALSFVKEITCPSHPICELIQCHFCREHLFNSQCWSLKDLYIAIVIGLIAAAIYIIATPFFLLYQLIRLLCCPIRCCSRWISHHCRRRPRNTTIPDAPNYQRKRRIMTQGLLTLFYVTSLSLFASVQGCSTTLSTTATSRNCHFTEDREECLSDAHITLYIQPLEQEICLILRDTDDRAFGQLEIKIESLTHRCQARSLFFTRDHKFYTDSSHRCYKAGSCRAEKCEETGPQDQIAELTNEANGSPGYTRCTHSCGCLTCGACFFCQPSCLFYRYYAKPTTSAVYEIFDCPTWNQYLTGTATLTRKGETEVKTSFQLDPARPFRWNHLTFTLVAQSVPPTPLLGSTFIRTGSQFAILPPTISLQGLHSPGQLKCRTKEDAQRFKCHFPAEACSCHKTSFSVNCACQEGQIGDFMKNILPTSNQHVTITPDRGQILAKTTSGTAVQLTVTARQLHWSTKTTSDHCKLQVLTQLHGCYSCLRGAEAEITCISTPGEELADLNCGTERTVFRCTPTGEKQIIRLSFSEKIINKSCRLTCGKNQQDVSLTGTLDFVSDLILHDAGWAPAHSNVHYEALGSIGNIIKDIFFLFFPVKTIILILVIAVIILIAYFLVYRRKTHQV